MKTKEPVRDLTGIRIFWIIIVVLIGLAAFSSCNKNQAADEQQKEQLIPPPPPPPTPPPPTSGADGPQPIDVVEIMPAFPGGDPALISYISDNIKYPEAAKKENIQGKVIVRFCVTAKGEIDRISILRGVSPDLDAESIRVVKSLPAFEPGKQDGIPVPVWYILPISFTLK